MTTHNPSRKCLRPIGAAIVALLTLLAVCLPGSLEARTIPNAPSNLGASAVSASQINVSWVDNSASEDGFRIERAADLRGVPHGWSQIATVVTNVTHYNDTGLSPKRKYWYRIRAFDTRTNSRWSNQASATTPPPPPAAPSSLTTTAVSTNQIDLSWTDNSTDEDGFKVEQSLDGATFTEIAQVLANTTNYLNNGLFPDTAYSYRVRAHNSAGNSDFSNVASARTPAPPCPLSVAGWGDNSYGQTTPPADLTNVVAIAAGYYHSLALKSDGTVVGWGYDYYATPPADLTNMVAIAAGIDHHSLALKSDGTVVGWGDDYYGEATPPAGLTGVVAIAAGSYHSLALLSDSTVVGWGYDGDGEATPPADLTNVVAIAAGPYHSLALKSDGTVVGWGYDYYATPPADLTNVVAIAAGTDHHSLALKSDGAVVGWGDDYYGEATPPADLTNAVAIAAGAFHSLALKDDGTVVGWGDDSSGQISGADGLTGVAVIGAGSYHSLALTTAPNGPLALTPIVVAANQVNLSWVDNAGNEDGFNIERAPDASGSPGTWSQIATVGVNITNYSDVGVETNATYWYRVQAFRSVCGDSPYSYPAIVSVVPPTYAPELYAYLVATNQVEAHLEWSDCCSYSRGVAGYKIERAPDVSGSPGTWTEIATTTGGYSYYSVYSDALATANATFWYRVRAYNGIGDSPYSNTRSVAVVPPAAPSNLTASIGTNQVNLYWNGDYLRVAGYKIERAPDAGGSPGTWAEIVTTVGTSTQYGDTGVTPDTTYWYRVRAYSALGDSLYSNTRSVTVVPPAAPSNLTASIGTDRVNLSWSGDYAKAVGYKIERAPDAGGSPGTWAEIATTVGMYGTTYGDTGVTLNTTYWYRVRAYSAFGDSPYSNTRSLVVVPPAAPSNLIATAAATNRVDLSWVDNSSNETGFKIERAPDSSGSPGTWAQIASVGTKVVNYSDVGVEANATYWYRVRAYNALGDSPYSNEASVTVVLPAAPSSLTAVPVSSSQIDLSWTDNSDSETGFKVERSTDGITFTQIAQVLANTTNYLNGGLFPDTTYYYRVRAYNGLGDSTFSNVADASTPALCFTAIVGWGDNGDGQTTPPADLTNAVAIAGGYVHSLALKSDGTVVGWGYNGYGQTTPPAGLTGVVAIAAGGYHSLALKNDGTVVGWGYNGYGQTTPPAGLSGVVAIAVGDYHSLALKNDGTVVGWGYNGYGQTTPPAGLSGVVAIAVGDYHSLALKSDGTVIGWGYNGYGQTTPTGGLSGVVAIAAGYYHSLALKSDGTVVGWGYNFYGQATPPAGLAGVVAIAAGSYHSLALKNDGTVVGWGYNGYGQTTSPAGLSGVVAIAAGQYHSLALSTVLGTPTALKATFVSVNEIGLSWTDKASNEDGFKIERALDEGGSPGTWTQIAVVGANITAYSDTSVTLNTTYWYRVLSYNTCGDSPFSRQVIVSVSPHQHGARFLFDAGHGQSAGNADWVIDADVHNIRWNNSGTFTISGNDSNAQRIPDPSASGITSSTSETYWGGAISAWAVDLVKRGHSVETLPAGATFTYETASAQDLLNYDVVVVDEPNILFTPAEKQALLNFVTDGGSLFLISDHIISDRNGDGEDSVTIWNDFLTNNGLTNNPFGITFRTTGTGSNSSGNNTFNHNIVGDPILNGPVGVATAMQYANGTEFQIDNAKNPTVISHMWFGTLGDSNNFCGLASLQYGNGRVVVVGDSSCVEDGTGDPGDNLFNGYTGDAGGVQHIWILNASEWLAAPFVPSTGFVVTPTNAFASAGYLGGPFSPAEQVYNLSNTNSTSLHWGVTNSASWLTISPTNGTLAGGATVDVTVSINPTANALSGGNYADTITFNNTTNGAAVKVDVSLAIQVSPIQAWQIQYFGSIGNSSAAPDADPDGDGQNNQLEFLAGVDPTNSASLWRFQVSPTNGALPLAVSFTENSTGSSITNRLWTFGDGTTGSGSNSSHTYTSAGTYSVGLTIFNLSGTSTLVAPNLITVSPVAIWTNANASGNWSVATSWDPVAIPDHNCGVIFGTAGVTANVDAVSRTLSNITFSRLGDFSVTASGGAALMISNGITVTTNFTYTISAPVVLGGTNTWSVTSNSTLQVSGPVSGSNSITKVGGGTLILSGTNAYSGGTIIGNGVLKIVGDGLVTNTASIDIAGGATLDVSRRTGGSMTLVSGQTLKGGGAVRGKMILDDGSAVSPGSSVDTLTFLGDLVVSDAAVLACELGTNSDLIAVSSNLTLGGTINITDAGGFNGGVYTLFTYGGTLAYDGVTLGTIPTGYEYTIDTNTAGQVKLNVVPTATISVEVAYLQDRFGNLAPMSAVAVLVADTGTNGFVDLQPTFPLSIGATWGSDDRVVGLWRLSDEGDGILLGTTVMPHTGGFASSQRLQLYWFPSLTLASNTVGVTYYGKYTDTNSPPLDGSDAWESGPSVRLEFITEDLGGSSPTAAGRATLSTATPPAARFTAGPVSGAEPLAVTFTDTSTGLSPLSLTWNLGDSTTTNTGGGASFAHSYPAGTYTVTLTASNSLGVSTLVSNNLVTALTALTGLQAWQIQYFGCTNPAVCPQASADADPDGDGLSNANELLSGTDPTNSASAFRVTAVAWEGIDLRVTWSMGAGKTNALQAATGSDSVTNSFTDVFVVTNTAGNTTNHLDVGAATNASPRYYRIRLVP